MARLTLKAFTAILLVSRHLVHALPGGAAPSASLSTIVTIGGASDINPAFTVQGQAAGDASRKTKSSSSASRTPAPKPTKTTLSTKKTTSTPAKSTPTKKSKTTYTEYDHVFSDYTTPVTLTVAGSTTTVSGSTYYYSGVFYDPVATVNTSITNYYTTTTFLPAPTTTTSRIPRPFTAVEDFSAYSFIFVTETLTNTDIVASYATKTISTSVYTYTGFPKAVESYYSTTSATVSVEYLYYSPTVVSTRPPVETKYAACNSRNVINYTPSGHGIDGIFSSQNVDYNNDGYAQNPYDCCMACQGTAGCAFSFFNYNNGSSAGPYCFFYTVSDGVKCDNSVSQGGFFWASDDTYGRDVYVSNGPCGQITPQEPY